MPLLSAKKLFLSCLMSAVTLTGCHMHKPDPDEYFEGPYLQAAHAIDANNEAQFKTAIAGIDVNRPGKKDLSLLWYAMIRKNYPAIRDLIAAGYQPDEHPAPGFGTPLESALDSDDLHILSAMLDGGLSPNLQTKKGRSSLLQRSIYGDKALERIQLLVERGADVNLRDSIGGTVLYDILNLPEPEIAIYLVEHGADVNAVLHNGVSIAYSVQVNIEQLDPKAKQAAITDFSVDDSGKMVTSTQTPPAPGLTPRGQELLKKYEELRDLMIKKGVTFPADPPAKMREKLGLHY